MTTPARAARRTTRYDATPAEALAALRRQWSAAEPGSAERHAIEQHARAVKVVALVLGVGQVGPGRTPRSTPSRSRR